MRINENTRSTFDDFFALNLPATPEGVESFSTNLG